MDGTEQENSGISAPSGWLDAASPRTSVVTGPCLQAILRNEPKNTTREVRRQFDRASQFRRRKVDGGYLLEILILR